jgi:hypothetical protein
VRSGRKEIGIWARPGGNDEAEASFDLYHWAIEIEAKRVATCTGFLTRYAERSPQWRRRFDHLVIDAGLIAAVRHHLGKSLAHADLSLGLAQQQNPGI